MDIFTNEVRELIDNAPTVEAIPKADYETRLKADMVAMLTEIQLEYKDNIQNGIIKIYSGNEKLFEIIQQKINALKGDNA